MSAAMKDLDRHRRVEKGQGLLPATVVQSLEAPIEALLGAGVQHASSYNRIVEVKYRLESHGRAIVNLVVILTES